MAENFSTDKLRFPAEWEPQDAILLAWPHPQTDWRPILPQVTEVYLELVRQISRFEVVIIITPQPEPVRSLLDANRIDLSQVFLISIETNDTWIRDFGPLTIRSDHGTVLLDFSFNGWGDKFAAEKDNAVNRSLSQNPRLQKCQYKMIDLVLEGGSIESDGNGTLLTTTTCLLNPNRNPHLNKKGLEKKLAEHFGSNHILWLDSGWLAGDDTDSHVDTLARLCPNDTLLYVCCDVESDEHFEELKRMEQQLLELKTKEGKPFRLIPLPWPEGQYDRGDRLPATYANYLVINNAVLVPTYNDPADTSALNIIASVFPDREVIGVDCQTLIRQHGSLHCATMQLPQGVLSWQH